ncbi:MAG: hypothetical protein M3O62_05130 [Pseudomonadota bacterium]|nr:hypothetical protein [Pseudomonadota bacterium]
MIDAVGIDHALKQVIAEFSDVIIDSWQPAPAHQLRHLTKSLTQTRRIRWLNGSQQNRQAVIQLVPERGRQPGAAQRLEHQPYS